MSMYSWSYYCYSISWGNKRDYKTTSGREWCQRPATLMILYNLKWMDNFSTISLAWERKWTASLREGLQKIRRKKANFIWYLLMLTLSRVHYHDREFGKCEITFIKQKFKNVHRLFSKNKKLATHLLLFSIFLIPCAINFLISEHYTIFF